jgi:hypothetical protein
MWLRRGAQLRALFAAARVGPRSAPRPKDAAEALKSFQGGLQEEIDLLTEKVPRLLRSMASQRLTMNVGNID